MNMIKELEFDIVFTKQDIKNIQELKKINDLNCAGILFEKESSRQGEYVANYVLALSSRGDCYETVGIDLITDEDIENIDVSDCTVEDGSDTFYFLIEKEYKKSLDLYAKVNLKLSDEKEDAYHG